MPDTAKVRVTACEHTYPTHPQRPCTAWMGEAAAQARTVAFGGTVMRRLASGSVPVAAAVSPRAAESMDGVHRCRRMHDHAADHGTQHQCACGFEWAETPNGA